MSKNSNNRAQQREFLDIPYAEHIVPFPNFASVLMQHAREFPDKIAIQFDNERFTYQELLQNCLSMEFEKDRNYDLGFRHKEEDLLRLLALLAQGIPFDLNFPRSGTYLRETKKIFREINIDYFDPPYVKLDDKAFVLNGEYEFSQYNVLVAAQAVGNAFKLFREGAAYCDPGLLTISDLVFGVLAPLYFAKSIYFTNVDEPDLFQYAWRGKISSSLRDAVMVGDDVNYHDNAYRLQESFDQALGLGPIFSLKGQMVKLLGVDIEKVEDKWTISGHCLGEKLA